jgi:hypothetical protein
MRNRREYTEWIVRLSREQRNEQYERLRKIDRDGLERLEGKGSVGV